MPDSG